MKHKMQYLKGLFDEIYLKDISERYEVRNTEILSQLTDDLCSSVGSLTNASKIARALSSSRKRNVDNETISSYIRFLYDSFLFTEAKRYDIKDKNYFDYPSKFYCSDTGLRNARLNFRQQEESHLMENVIYNELACRGYSVDVGVIKTGGKDDGYRNREIDFVVMKYYIQSSLRMDDQAKTEQELRPLLGVRDFFRKIVVSKTTVPPWTDELGIIHMGIYDFLLDKRSIEQ
jgi:predicted AAA+ superfamily ATPase